MLCIYSFPLKSSMVTLLVCGMGFQVTFVNNNRDVYEIEPSSSTGLKKIYVLYDTDGVGMTYTATTENPVSFFVYDEMGGAYAQPVEEGITVDGLNYTLQQVIPNKGYILEEGTTRYYIWVTDYSDYRLKLNGISAADLPAGNVKMFFGEGDDTDGLTPNPSPKREGSAGAWYTIDGRRVSGKPTQKGIYVNNGRKVVIK